MTSNSEVLGEGLRAVPQITVPSQNLSGGEIKRITSLDTLDDPFVRGQIERNRLAEVVVTGKRWLIFAPYGSYSPRAHLMIMRRENEYTPGLESVSPQEGEDLRPVIADIAYVMMEDPENSVVIYGWNESRRSFGQRGYQSIPTRWHPSIFSLPELTPNNKDSQYLNFVGIGNLNTDERRAIIGGIYNKVFGRFMLDYSLNGHFKGDQLILNDLLDLEAARVDYRGIRVPLRRDLATTLSYPGVFKNLLQPIAIDIDNISCDLSNTFTDLDTEEVDKRIEEVVTSPTSEEDRQQVIGFLTRTPMLLPTTIRAQNIERLSEKGYPGDLIAYLRRLNSRLPDVGPASGWKVGFGYALAMRYDRHTQTGSLAIFFAVADGPGGIVEGTEGAILRRPPDPFPPDEIAAKKESYRRLMESVDARRDGHYSLELYNDL